MQSNVLNDLAKAKRRRTGKKGEAEERNVLLAEALERSKIPDKYGCWRPRSTKRYIMTGDRPTAPLPIPGGARQDGLVNIRRGCFFKNAELIYISFSMLYSKKRYLMNSLINLQSRLATLNDLMPS